MVVLFLSTKVFFFVWILNIILYSLRYIYSIRLSFRLVYYLFLLSLSTPRGANTMRGRSSVGTFINCRSPFKTTYKLTYKQFKGNQAFFFHFLPIINEL